MIRRLTYALAAAAVALGIAVGVAGGYPALAGVIGSPPDTYPPSVTDGPPMAVKWEGPDFDLATAPTDPGDDPKPVVVTG